MNKTVKKLLNIIQADFPLESRPYQKIADDLGISEEEVIVLMQELKLDGSIKRIGGIFNSKELGYHSTLCAASVPSERVSDVADIINGYQGVTHNYIRSHEFNMWFTIIAPSFDCLEKQIEEIKCRTGIEKIINLPATKLFKINVNFEMRE
jgi:DNA-binding Lrp family transcriptional regulator